MKQLKSLQPHDLVTCMRCGKMEFVGNADKWNIEIRKGVPVGAICPDCQTQEEFVEAEVNDALVDYSKMYLLNTPEEAMEALRPFRDKALEAIASGAVEDGDQLFRRYLQNYMNIHNAMLRQADSSIEVENLFIPDIETAFAVLAAFGEIPQPE